MPLKLFCIKNILLQIKHFQHKFIAVYFLLRLLFNDSNSYLSCIKPVLYNVVLKFGVIHIRIKLGTAKSLKAYLKTKNLPCTTGIVNL